MFKKFLSAVVTLGIIFGLSQSAFADDNKKDDHIIFAQPDKGATIAPTDKIFIITDDKITDLKDAFVLDSKKEEIPLESKSYDRHTLTLNLKKELKAGESYTVGMSFTGKDKATIDTKYGFKVKKASEIKDADKAKESASPPAAKSETKQTEEKNNSFIYVIAIAGGILILAVIFLIVWGRKPDSK